MSYEPGQLASCPDIQDELDRFFPTCGHDFRPDPAPLYQFLLSEQNRGGIQQTLMPSENKVRTLILTYNQPIPLSQVVEVDGCTRQCDATTKRGDLTSTYEIDTCDTIRVEESMNYEDFKNSCKSNFRLVRDKFALMLKAIEEKQAERMTARAITKYGAWQANVNMAVSGGTVTVEDNTGNSARALKVQTFKSSGDIYPIGIHDLNSGINKTNFCNGAAIFSGTLLSKYAQLMQSGCCADQGLDLASLMSRYGYAVVYDRLFENAMGAEYAMALAPRVMQYVYYLRNNNGVADAAGVTVGTNYQKQVIFGANGTPVDLFLKDDCENGLSIVMETTGDVVTLPTDLWHPSHHMEGVTWVNKIKVINP